MFLKNILILVVEYEHINLRAVNARPTKASIVISFQLFGTLMCFICSHFAGNLRLRKRTTFLEQYFN